MRKIRRLLLALAFMALVIAVVLLLNVTAPNPTGRRYSSEMPRTAKETSFAEAGREGEDVLAVDLRLLPNRATPRQCICNSHQNPSEKMCSCFAYVQTMENFRYPDFVGNGFIADSKNCIKFPCTNRDVAEISDYIRAAQTLKWPLWIYTRVDTKINAACSEQIEATGGGVVPYFTVPGYMDPVDQAALRVAVVAGGIVLVMSLWELASRRQPRTVTVPATNPPAAPRRPKSPNPLGKADAADDFIQRSKDRARSIIDTDDTWSEID